MRRLMLGVTLCTILCGRGASGQILVNSKAYVLDTDGFNYDIGADTVNNSLPRADIAPILSHQFSKGLFEATVKGGTIARTLNVSNLSIDFTKLDVLTGNISHDIRPLDIRTLAAIAGADHFNVAVHGPNLLYSGSVVLLS